MGMPLTGDADVKGQERNGFLANCSTVVQLLVSTDTSIRRAQTSFYKKKAAQDLQARRDALVLRN